MRYEEGCILMLFFIGANMTFLIQHFMGYQGMTKKVY
jgi:heme/copper-type cytochrome/quinol oxidase subunit 1